MTRSRKSLIVLYFLAAVAIAAVVFNVFYIGITGKHLRSGISLDNYMGTSFVSETLYGKRGNIYDANGQVVAQNTKTWDIICILNEDRPNESDIPAYVDDIENASHILSQYLDLNEDEIYDILYKAKENGLYQTELRNAGRGILEETKNAILKEMTKYEGENEYRNLHGIEFKESTKRVYPYNDSFATYLIGFAQRDTDGRIVGKMGLEKTYNEELTGTDGVHTSEISKKGYVLPGMYDETVEAKDGYNIYTTIDSSIQWALDDSFDEIVTENDASKAWGAVVEISTGKILAWGQTPGFDPNVLEIEDYLNAGSQYAYEPGSVFKSVIYAAAIDLGVYDEDATFDSSTYCYLSNGNKPYRTYSSDNYGCITNAAGKSWGDIDFDHGLIYSSNVATMTLLEEYVGTRNFIDYVDRFGFFNEVDSDGIEEVTGVKNYYYPSEKLSLTYGQGSSVTMLQLLQAYTAIFGNGEMVKPYFIDKIVDPETNEIIYEGQREVVSTPIKESTARKLQSILERVVSDPAGTAQYYAVDEVNIIAKTGTSEISLVGEGYNSEDSISSIMLAYPAENPQYMIYYAYISPYHYLNHLNSSVIKKLISRCVILTDSQETEETESSDYYEYTMPDLERETLENAEEILSEYGLNVMIIGDGNSIIGQYPLSGKKVSNKEKVFLLTNGKNYILPDFTGWTRNEVINYWNLSGLEFTLEGYGTVIEQSIAPNSYVSNEDIVVLTFEMRGETDPDQEEESE